MIYRIPFRRLYHSGPNALSQEIRKSLTDSAAVGVDRDVSFSKTNHDISLLLDSIGQLSSTVLLQKPELKDLSYTSEDMNASGILLQKISELQWYETLSKQMVDLLCRYNKTSMPGISEKDCEKNIELGLVLSATNKDFVFRPHSDSSYSAQVACVLYADKADSLEFLVRASLNLGEFNGDYLIPYKEIGPDKIKLFDSRSLDFAAVFKPISQDLMGDERIIQEYSMPLNQRDKEGLIEKINKGFDDKSGVPDTVDVLHCVKPGRMGDHACRVSLVGGLKKIPSSNF